MWWTPLVIISLLQTVVGADPPAPWWDNAVYYRILVDSFKDGDGDGLGDLMGLAMEGVILRELYYQDTRQRVSQAQRVANAAGATKQLSYVKALGCDAVILSPIMGRSKDCARPGVVDFNELDPRYGSLDSLQGFLDKAKKTELKPLITLPLQTVSSSSEWFASSASKTPGYDDWVMWKDENEGGEQSKMENNMESWIKDDVRSAYYATKNNETVLNLCSESLVAALAASQCAWLRRGFAGLVLQPDFPPDQSCSVNLVRKMAAEAMSCVRASNLETPLILVETAQDPETATSYYSDGGIGANSVISIAMVSEDRKSSPELAMKIHAALLYASSGALPTWTTSSSEYSHLATRYGNDIVDAINILTLTLPGAAIIQQGDELGAADTILEWASMTDTCWPRQPAPYYAPFSWDSNVNAGFSSGDPWLPLTPNYRYANAKTQFSNDASHVGVVRIVTAMRKSPAMGPNAEIKRLGQSLAILRWGDTGSLLAVSNLGKDQSEVQLSKIPGIAPTMTVASSSSGSSLASGSHVSTDKTIKLMPGETALLAGPPRHCGGPGPVDKITTKLTEGWQKLNKYFGSV